MNNKQDLVYQVVNAWESVIGTGHADAELHQMLSQLPEQAMRDFVAAVDRVYEDDGQPSELEEWLDFDPDC